MGYKFYKYFKNQTGDKTVPKKSQFPKQKTNLLPAQKQIKLSKVIGI